ncbi:MAG: FAD-dependent oxidoreductase [Deltaproteobacteria bacterium]|nr:FAD-dependent oxidoreductase [Deltaproteobacteria bacterium]
MTTFRKLFEPGRIGSMELKNRLIMAPMGTSSHDREGFIQERTVYYYVERAKGGVGLIIAQSSNALREGQAPGRAGTWDDKFIPGLRRVAEGVHAAGGKIAWQILNHGKLYSAWLDRITHPEDLKIIGPSAIPWVRTGVAPKEATKEDIRRIVEGFGEAARRVKEAGMDAVEIHGAHGYMITQWLSPRDNRRSDEYGGDAKKRAGMACEIVAKVREKVGPNFPVIFRFSGSHFIEGGGTLEDSLIQAPLFVEAGADALHVSACEEETTYWQFLPYPMPDGAIVHLAAAIKRVVNVPVIAVGKIWDPRMAEQILEEGKADFVALGRQLLADPQWPNKVKEGRFEEVQRCLYCNNCLNMEVRLKEVRERGRTCTVNPAVLRERQFGIKPARAARSVMIIGGGLAGMEAARVLAERGHQVKLYERSDRLGGQWNIAAVQPLKENYRYLVPFMEKGLERAKVKVILNKEVTLSFIKETNPDAVVVATGALSKTLEIPGAHSPHVVQANDVIMGNKGVGNPVIVIGGRLVGMETADALAEQDRQVFLVTEDKLGENGAPLERNIYRAMRDRLIRHGLYLFPDSPVVEILPNGVHIAYKHEIVFLKAETVVMAVGAVSNDALWQELKKEKMEAYAIGDCVEPRDAMEAIREGAEVGRMI